MNCFAKGLAALVVCLSSSWLASPAAQAADDCCLPLAFADSPVRYFDGASYSFTAPCFAASCYPPHPCHYSFSGFTTSYYTPGYYSRAYAPKNISALVSPSRNSAPWPYFYTPAGDYTPGYYGYYYTPGYFRY